MSSIGTDCELSISLTKGDEGEANDTIMNCKKMMIKLKNMRLMPGDYLVIEKKEIKSFKIKASQYARKQIKIIFLTCERRYFQMVCQEW